MNETDVSRSCAIFIRYLSPFTAKLSILMPHVVSLRLFGYVSPHAPSPAQAPHHTGQYVSLIGAGAAGAALSNTQIFQPAGSCLVHWYLSIETMWSYRAAKFRRLQCG